MANNDVPLAGRVLPRAWKQRGEDANGPINETAATLRTPFEETVCAMAGRVLMRDFPGFHWAIRVNEATGMWHLLNQDLSGEWGYTGKTGDIFSASDFEKEVRMAAGGILEYFGVRRGAASQDELVQLPQDFAGRVLAHGKSDRVFNKRDSYKTKNATPRQEQNRAAPAIIIAK
jgi:hypothetical protein